MAVSQGFKNASGFAQGKQDELNAESDRNRRIVGDYWYPPNTLLYFVGASGFVLKKLELHKSSGLMDDVVCIYNQGLKKWSCYAVPSPILPVVHWPFNNNFLDVSSNGLNLTYNISPSWYNLYDFISDRAGDPLGAIEIHNHRLLHYIGRWDVEVYNVLNFTDCMSISAWAIGSLSINPSPWVLCRDDYEITFEFGFDNNFFFSSRRASGPAYKIELSETETEELAGSWHFYTFTYNNPTAKLYVDGVLRKQYDSFLPIRAITEIGPRILIGYAFGTKKLDDIKMWDVEINQKQIIQEYNLPPWTE